MILTKDMCDDADIRAKRAELIGSVNRLNTQFRVVSGSFAADVLYCLVWVSDVAPQYNSSQRDEYLVEDGSDAYTQLAENY